MSTINKFLVSAVLGLGLMAGLGGKTILAAGYDLEAGIPYVEQLEDGANGDKFYRLHINVFNTGDVEAPANSVTEARVYNDDLFDHSNPDPIKKWNTSYLAWGVEPETPAIPAKGFTHVLIVIRIPVERLQGVKNLTFMVRVEANNPIQPNDLSKPYYSGLIGGLSDSDPPPEPSPEPTHDPLSPGP